MEMFTQCACVLFDEAPAIDEIDKALDGWAIREEQPAAPGEDGWAAWGPGRVVELRGGRSVLVDVVDRAWPDDPRAAAEVPSMRAAWSSGMFGPCSSPGALARAAVQSWSWEDAPAAARRHRAFVRVRTAVELTDAEPRLPADHDPVHELGTVTELAGALLRLRGATALFVPGGEALRSRAQVEAVLRRKAGLGPPPIELWANARAVPLGHDGAGDWLLVDVIGMRQLRLPDQEALFVEGEAEAEAVAALLRNVCLHLAQGKPIPEGSTSDDPRGRRWLASAASGILAPADRPVLRWLLERGSRPSDALMSSTAPRSG
jgi:Domain of unknown function (DUF4261)